jgi:hypothetical protein
MQLCLPWVINAPLVRQIEFDAGTAVHIGVECAEVCAPRLAILWPGFDTRKRHRFTCGLCRGLPKPATPRKPGRGSSSQPPNAIGVIIGRDKTGPPKPQGELWSLKALHQYLIDHGWSRVTPQGRIGTTACKR